MPFVVPLIKNARPAKNPENRPRYADWSTTKAPMPPMTLPPKIDASDFSVMNGAGAPSAVTNVPNQIVYDMRMPTLRIPAPRTPTPQSCRSVENAGVP